MTANFLANRRPDPTAHDARRHPWRLLLGLVLAFAAAGFPAVIAADPADQLIFAPDVTAAALLVQPFEPGELPGAKTPTEITPTRGDVVHRIEVAGDKGFVSYDIFASSREARLYDISSFVETIPLDGLPDYPAVIKETSDGAASCAIVRNIQVCGWSNGSISKKPATDALASTAGGIKHLLRIAKPTAVAATPESATPVAPNATPAGATPRALPTDTPIAAPAGTAVATPAALSEADLNPASGDNLASALPATIEVTDGPPFSLDKEGAVSFDDTVARLSALDDPADLLRGLGWQAGYLRSFSRDSAPAGELTWLQLSLQVFSNPENARSAMNAFAQARAAGTPLQTGAAPALGDASMLLAGPSNNGAEVSIYTVVGNRLLRVTGVTAVGDPAGQVAAVAGQLAASLAR